MRILFQYPSRSRPYRFLHGLETILKYSVERHQITIHAVLDIDDPALDTYKSMIDETSPFIDIITSVGVSKSKVDAINRPLPDIEWSILVCMSDDQRFTVYGFDKMIREQFNDGLDKFVHFYERYSGDRVSVLDIVGRDYYLRDKFIYNPEYTSLFCDEEKTCIARIRNRYKFVEQEIFFHDNAAITGMGEQDDLLISQQSIGYSIDQQIFKTRKENNFYL